MDGWSAQCLSLIHVAAAADPSCVRRHRSQFVGTKTDRIVVKASRSLTNRKVPRKRKMVTIAHMSDGLDTISEMVTCSYKGYACKTSIFSIHEVFSETECMRFSHPCIVWPTPDRQDCIQKSTFRALFEQNCSNNATQNAESLSSRIP